MGDIKLSYIGGNSIKQLDDQRKQIVPVNVKKCSLFETFLQENFNTIYSVDLRSDCTSVPSTFTLYTKYL